jgi:hypothetical protein
MARMVTFACVVAVALLGASGDWPEPRQNSCLTGMQPLGGAMKEPPVVVASFDLGRSAPAITPVSLSAGETVGLCIVAGALSCYTPDGALKWSSHPPRILWRYGLPAGSGSPIAADLDRDDKCEIAVPTADGRVLVLAAVPDP